MIAVGLVAVAYNLALASAAVVLVLTAAVMEIRGAERQTTMIQPANKSDDIQWKTNVKYLEKLSSLKHQCSCVEAPDMIVYCHHGKIPVITRPLRAQCCSTVNSTTLLRLGFSIRSTEVCCGKLHCVVATSFDAFHCGPIPQEMPIQFETKSSLSRSPKEC